MVGTIVPMGHGERKQRMLVVGLHGVGTILGGALTGSILGLVGEQLRRASHLPPPAFIATALLLALLYSMRESRLVHIPAPNTHRQVPSRWRRLYPAGPVSLAYGLLLGVGFLTSVPVMTFYVANAWVLLFGTPTTGGILGGIFGLGRWLPILVVGLKASSSSQAYYLTKRWDTWAPAVHLINGIFLGTGAGVMMAVLLSK